MSLKKINEKKYSVPTRLIYGQSPTFEWDYSHHVVPPITTSSTFSLGSAERGAKGFAEFSLPPQPDHHPIYIYDRMGEPTIDMLQHVLATAEEQECCVVFSSGMAAVQAAVCFALNPGSEIISHKTVYGCTYSLFTNQLSRMGIKVHFCDLTDANSFVPLVNENTRVLYLESPANPNLELIDTPAIVEALKKINANRAESKKILSVFDNTFATPFCQRPGKDGVDVIVHSLTKGLSGFGTVMGGAVITRQEFHKPLIIFRKDYGSILPPLNAWHILVYGIPTLCLRIPRQQANALKVAQFLESHAMVDIVRYPGMPSFPQYQLATQLLRDYDGNFAPGIMIYFRLKGEDPEQSKLVGERMMDYLADNAYAITLAVSLGQIRTLIEHPASMSHVSYPALEQISMGIDPGGIRLAVGIENPDDIICDLDSALKHAFKAG